MFEWLCSIGLIWGLLITGVGVIIAMIILIAVGCFIAVWVGELWEKIPYRVTESIGKVFFVIKIIVCAMAVLAGIIIVTMIVYVGICPP